MSQVKQRARPIGAITDELWTERETKRAKEAEVKEVEGRIALLETELLERLEKEGLDAARGTKASVSISAAVSANVEDWDAFWAFIAKNKYFHLVQRRVSDPAYREMLDLGKKVAGVQPFTKKRLNVRTL